HKVDTAFVTEYLKKICASSTSYYSCMAYNGNWVSTLTSIFEYLDPTVNNMTKLITSFIKISNLTKVATDQNIFTLWKTIIKKINEIPISVFMEGITARNYDTLLVIVDYTKTDSKCIEELCKIKTDNKCIIQLIDKIFLQKVHITTTALNNAIGAGSSELAISFLKKGVQPNIISLVNACHQRDQNLINMLLMCKLIPTKECFEALIPNTQYYNSDNNKVAMIIDMLIQCGYNITYDDVMFALGKKQHINNIKRFNIKFDNKIIEKCSQMGYYPYSEKDIGVKPTLECLRIECSKSGNIKTLKTLVSSGLKPDIECLRNACKIRNNIANIRYLIEKNGLKCDVECLKNMAQSIGNKALSYVLENTDLQQASNKDKSQVDKVKFSDGEEIDDISESKNEDEEDENNESVESSGTSGTSGSNESDSNQSKNIFKLTRYAYDKNLQREANYGFIIKTLLDGTQALAGIDEKHTGQISEIPEDKIKLGNELIKGMSIGYGIYLDPKKINTGENPKKNNSTPSNILKFTALPEADMQKIDMRKKYLLTPEASLLFGIKKTTKMSIIEVRNNIIKYIIDNDLIDEQIKTLVKLDDALIKLLKVDKKQYDTFDFNNIEGLIYKMIKL
ncbi:MAG: hypothetical protein MUO21_02470, partial [Nitrososphaeraceae archaeon]|nr:hypothetical protein [Nitrososphaeraceae archaeon]